MKSEELKQLLKDERSAAREQLQFWIGKRDEADRRMNEARQYLEQVETLLSFFDKPKAEAVAVLMFKEEGERHSRYEDLSIADAAYEVLKEAGVPLHAKRILAAILMGGKVISSKTPHISVSSALLRDDRFENIGGNTFRIKESARDEDGDGMS